MLTPYCTTQDVIDCCSWPAFGQLTASAQARLINAATERVNAICRRPLGFAQQMVTETISGRNQSALWLTTRPVISIETIFLNEYYLDNSLGDAWTFEGKSGKVVRGRGNDDTRFVPYWPAGEANIVLQYWAGYQTFPDDLVCATAFYVKYLREQGTSARHLLLGVDRGMVGDPQSGRADGDLPAAQSWPCSPITSRTTHSRSVEVNP